jgi:hypothetical protein
MAEKSRPQRWTPPELRPQIAPGYSWLPSWLVSVCLHGSLMMLFATGIQSCDQGHSGAAEEDFREVGIYVKQGDAVSETNPDTPDDSEADRLADSAVEAPPTEAELAAATTAALSELPASLLDLPPVEAPGTLGAGALISLPSSVASADVVTGIDGSPAASSLRTAAQGETSFFDIRATGSRFVYVVDHSGSMGFYQQLQVAKRELRASLEALDATQQFQILFYNGRYTEMTLRDRPPSLQWATDINKTLGVQFIGSITPDGGTDHMPALRQALSYQPDHLYFLTDADQPQLSARDLAEVRRINRNRTQIHCVEFGTQGDLGVDNFLKRLARENGGTYRYRDVTRFGTRK